MNDLRLRFLDSPVPDLDLGTGVHRVHADAQGQLSAAGEGPAVLSVHRDRRGLWLTLGSAAHGVHLNGRPIRRLALLRAGDRLHVGSQAMQVCGDAAPAPVDASAGTPPAEAGRWLLRGLGGVHHGRAFTLDRDLAIGGDDAGIAIDGSAAALAVVRARDGQVLATATDPSVPLLVNGQTMTAAGLQPGDQLLVGGQRLLLETPSANLVPVRAPEPMAFPAPDQASEAQSRPAPRRIPWLLLAALLLAGALAALLLLGG